MVSAARLANRVRAAVECRKGCLGDRITALEAHTRSNVNLVGGTEARSGPDGFPLSGPHVSESNLEGDERTANSGGAAEFFFRLAICSLHFFVVRCRAAI